MRIIQILETLLESLDEVKTVDEVRELVEQAITEEYESQGIIDAYDEMFNGDEEERK